MDPMQKASLDQLLAIIPPQGQQTLDQKISDIHLAEIARTLTNWESVCSNLGITEPEEEAIREENARSDARRRAVLRKWRSKYGRIATYRNLADCFYRADRSEMVEAICKVLGASSGSAMGQQQDMHGFQQAAQLQHHHQHQPQSQISVPPDQQPPGYPQQSYGFQQPPLGQQPPGQPTPWYSQPPYGLQQPSSGQQPPGQPTPGYHQQPYNVQQPPPGWQPPGQQLSGYPQPPYGVQQPSSGQQLPGQPTPGYHQEPYYSVQQPPPDVLKPTERQLMIELHNTVANNWRAIGTYLEIPGGQLNIIANRQRDDPQKCLMDMLSGWLQQINPPASWPDIAEAVEFTGRPDIAQIIRQKYCSVAQASYQPPPPHQLPTQTTLPQPHPANPSAPGYWHGTPLQQQPPFQSSSFAQNIITPVSSQPHQSSSVHAPQNVTIQVPQQMQPPSSQPAQPQFLPETYPQQQPRNYPIARQQQNVPYAQQLFPGSAQAGQLPQQPPQSHPQPSSTSPPDGSTTQAIAAPQFQQDTADVHESSSGPEEELEGSYLSSEKVTTDSWGRKRFVVKKAYDDRRSRTNIKLTFATLVPGEGERPFSSNPPYDMRHHPHGIAVIINNKKFEPSASNPDLKLSKRVATDTDEKNLSRTFRFLGYNVEIYREPKAEEMVKILKKIAGRSAEHDSFVCCILSHGKEDKIYASNSELVDLEAIVSPLKSCENLRGKPKMFFVQACRGKEGEKAKVDCGVKLRVVTDSESKNPSESDFFLSCATPPGYIAWHPAIKDDKKGSPYIKALCETFCKTAKHSNLEEMHKKINEEVSKYESDAGCKQIPEVQHTLCKNVYFF